jgi:hypothetical protein
MKNPVALLRMHEEKKLCLLIFLTKNQLKKMLVAFSTTAKEFKPSTQGLQVV